MERMDCDNGASSGEEEFDKLRNKENESSSDDESSISSSDEENTKDINEVKQGSPSNSELEDSESGDDESSSESDEDENDDKSLPAKTYVPKGKSKHTKLVVDESAYHLLCKSRTSYPCMSFDVIQDNQGEGEDRSARFPISMSIVSGTYSGKKNADSLIVMKYSKLFPGSKNTKDPHQIITEQDSKQQSATLRYVKISHSGSVNRVRVCKNTNSNTICSSWSENGRVYIYDLTKAIKAIASDKLMNSFNAKSIEPIFTFKGHSKEGFALDWSPTKPGTLSSGDQDGKIYIWSSNEFNNWNVNDVPLSGHTGSIEDLQWSPTEENILASCSTDKSIRVFDIRTSSNTSMVKINNAHESDVNVISWNKLDNPFLLSGGDDGAIKCWDLRSLSRSSNPSPIATFNHHTLPITSIEWNPNDSSVFVASSEDDQVSIWDLSCEKDNEQNVFQKDQDQDELDKLPPQLLFIHQGQKEIKEVHWHSQLPGYLISTSLTGIDIFRTISV